MDADGGDEFMDERRQQQDRRTVDSLRAELLEARAQAQQARIDAALAAAHEKIAAAALKAESATENSDTAIEIASQAKTTIDRHEDRCELRYQEIATNFKAVAEKFDKLDGIPGLVVEISERLRFGTQERQRQHEEVTESRRAMEADIKLIKDKMSGTRDNDQKLLIKLMWGLIGTLLGFIVWLVAHYILPAHP